MRVPAHAAVAATVDLAAATVGRAGHRPGERGAAAGGRQLTSPAGWTGSPPGWTSATGWRSRPPTRAGSSTRSPTCCRTPSWRPRCAADNELAPVTLAVRPGLAEVERADGGGGRARPVLAVRRPLVGQPGRPGRRTRGPGRRTGRGLAAGRRRARPRATARSGRGWTCAPDRAARPPCWPGSPVPDERAAWPPRSRRTGRRWSGRRCGPTRRRRPCWWPTAPARRGARARSPGCWSTPRAPGWARSAAGRSPAGAASRTTSSRCTGCSSPCWPRPSTAPLRAAWSATSPAHRTAGRPSTWSRRRWPRRDDVEVVPADGLLPPTVEDGATGDYVQLWPHRHGTDAMFAAYLRRRG